LTGDLEGLRTTHRPDLHRQVLLHWTSEGEQAVVLEELALEGDRALVEEGADHLDGLLDPRQRLGARPLDVVLGEQPEVPARETARAAPAGELVERGRRLGNERRLAENYTGQARSETDVRRVPRRCRE